MDQASDGVTPVIFGVLLADGCYDAHRGEAEFRGGRLVRVEFGHFRDENPGGLTAGYTTFPTLAPGPPDADGFTRAPGVNHVYARGELVTTVDLGWVSVRLDQDG
jgi:hypothetical protein